jgi:hypothetical protein
VITLTLPMPARQVGARGVGEIGAAFEADHLARQLAQARGEEAAAGADFQDVVARGECQRLQGAAFDHRLHHHFAVAQRQGEVGVGQGAVRGGHEAFARQRGEHVEHARIEHVPGANLLFDHQFTGLGEIDRAHLGDSVGDGGVPILTTGLVPSPRKGSLPG